jgi:hypothetical protein
MSHLNEHLITNEMSHRAHGQFIFQLACFRATNLWTNDSECSHFEIFVKLKCTLCSFHENITMAKQ